MGAGSGRSQGSCMGISSSSGVLSSDDDRALAPVHMSLCTRANRNTLFRLERFR